MIRAIGILFFVAILLSFCTMSSWAQEHRHGDEIIPAVTGRFYETWDRPDMPGVSCCNRMDCAVVGGVRRVNGRLQAFRKKDGVWLTVPPEKVEHNRDSPDGESHMCSLGAVVYCFIFGTGT